MSKKVISVDPVIPFFLIMCLMCTAAGIFIKGSFLTPAPPPPVDLHAEYCRGVSDEALRGYNAMRDFLLDQQGKGQLISATPVERMFGELPPDYIEIVTEVCLTYTTPEQMAQAGMRGPSDMTTTVMGGANIPERDE